MEHSPRCGDVDGTRGVTMPSLEARTTDRTLLRLARRFAAEGDPRLLLTQVVAEAAALVAADDAGISTWDPQREALITVTSLVPPSSPGLVLDPRDSVSGQAADQRRVILVHDYQATFGASTPAGGGGAQAVIAVPLLYEDRLLGALSVTATTPGARFTEADGESLEMLAGLAAAALVGIERARLEGALLAIRTAEHELNNRLALVVGYTELIAEDPALPPHLGSMAHEALGAAQSAASILESLQDLHQLQERNWGPDVGSTIDVAASLA